MSNSVVQLKYDELGAIAKSLHQEGEDIAHLHALTRRKMNDLRDDWVGDAADAFYTEMESRLLPGVNRLSLALIEAENVLTRIMNIIHNADVGTAAFFKDFGDVSSGSAKKTRIYLINGINYNGDPKSLNDLREQLKAKYGKDVEVVVVGENDSRSHPYSTDLSKYATHFGGLLSPVDWLTARGLELTNTVVGVGQVVREYITGGSTESQKVFQWIQDDMARNGLIGDKDLNVVLVGHSGGGAIAGNIVDDIENKLKVNVSGLVTMGSPISNYDNASAYAEKIIDIRNQADLVGNPLGLGTIRSDEMRVGWLLPLGTSRNPIDYLGSVTGMDQGFRNPNINVQNITTQDGGYFQWNPLNWIDAHGSYWNSPTVVDAIGSMI